MKELYIEGVASHDGREPCVGACEGAGEASVAARAGQVLSRVITEFGVPTSSTRSEGNTASSVIASCWWAPRGQGPCACTEPPCARTGRSRACPPGDHRAGRSGKAKAVRLR
jgi:hypothetical protein